MITKTKHFRKFLIIFLMFPIVIIFTSQNAYAWWDLNWIYRAEVNISNFTGDLTGAQIFINVTWRKGMQEDFSDLRFVDNDDVTILPYFIENYVNRSYAEVWVRLKDNDTTIYMYWGNPNAISESNPYNVFDFYDDFEGTDLDTTKWTIARNTNSPTIAVSNSWLKVQGSLSSGEFIALMNFTPTTRFIVEEFVNFTSGVVNENSIVWYSDDTADNHYLVQVNYDGTTSWTLWWIKQAGTYSSISTDSYAYEIGQHKATLVVVDSTFYLYFDDILISQVTHTSLTSGKIGIRSASNRVLEIDWIRVRKYIGEPVTTIGTTEVGIAFHLNQTHVIFESTNNYTFSLLPNNTELNNRLENLTFTEYDNTTGIYKLAIHRDGIGYGNYTFYILDLSASIPIFINNTYNLTIYVTDLNGNPLQNVPVSYTKILDNGSLEWDSAYTDQFGKIQVEIKKFYNINSITVILSNIPGFYDKTEIIPLSVEHTQHYITLSSISGEYQIILEIYDAYTFEPIEGATVDTNLGTKTTDSFGRVSFFELSPNDITATITKTGYYTKTITVTPYQQVLIQRVFIYPIKTGISTYRYEVEFTFFSKLLQIKLSQDLCEDFINATIVLATDKRLIDYPSLLNPNPPTYSVKTATRANLIDCSLYVLKDSAEQSYAKILINVSTIRDPRFKEVPLVFTSFKITSQGILDDLRYLATPEQLALASLILSFVITSGVALSLNFGSRRALLVFIAVLSVFTILGLFPKWLLILMAFIALLVVML